MKGFLLTIIILNCMAQDCCPENEQQRKEPSYPNQVTGWKYREEMSLRILGDFVLRKNENTDNGKVQIKLLDLIPGEPCADAGTIRHQAQAKLQFVRLSDQKVLCEDTFVEKGSITISAGKCGSNLNDFGLLSVGIDSINIKDGWVFFYLLG